MTSEESFIVEAADPLVVEAPSRASFGSEAAPKTEDQRLIQILDSHLGLSNLQAATRQAVLRTVCRGLAKTEGPEAAAWQTRLERCSHWPVPEKSRSPHPLLPVLAAQPCVGLTRDEQDHCRTVGGRAFIALGFQLRELPKDFPHGLKQLFRNRDASWGKLRDQLVNGQLDAEISLENDAAERFRAQVRRLFATPLARPSVSSGPKPSESAPIEQEQSPDSYDERPEEETDDVEPARDLFEREVQRCMQAELVDGNRLPLHWKRLSVAETQRVFKRIRKNYEVYAKDRSQLKRAAYTAMRVLSFHACMSMRDCFRMPLGPEGDMYLDLRRGLIVRDWSRAAPARIRPAHMDRRIETFVTLDAMTLSVFLELQERHPSARTCGELVQAEDITLRMMGQALNTDWPTSHRPEDARFAISWGPVLLELGVHPAVVARMTGDTMTTSITDQVYVAIHDDDIDSAMRKSCEWLGLTHTEMPQPRELRGSAKYHPIADLSALVARLQGTVEEARQKIKSRASLEEVVEFHNLYITAVALCIEWMHGTRCSKPERRTVEALIASEDYLCVSDKKTDLYGQLRILTKTKMCRDLLNGLCEHFVATAAWLKKRGHPAARQLERLSTGQLSRSPLFLLLETSGPNNRGYRDLRRKDLANFFISLAGQCDLQFDQDDLNCFRHFFYSELVHRNLQQVAIDSLLGHHTVGAEPHGFFAGASLREIADYVRPELAKLQHDLGFVSFAGLGRTHERYLRAPHLALDREIMPLPNQYLLRKLDEDEQLVKDFFARQQDPPATMQTLRLHAAVEAIKNAYLDCGLVAKHSAGALLACLILFDGVLAPVELRNLYGALITLPPYGIGAHAIAEVVQDRVPVLQRSLSDDTLAAWALLANANGEIPWESAVEQLHEMLRALRRGWPGTSATESLTLLASMTSHWAAIEVAPGSMFGVHHKAPFMPAHHLARIEHKRPCLPDQIVVYDVTVRMLRPYTMFSAPMAVIRKWADNDEKLGESATRRVKCRTELEALLDDATLDFYERELINQLIADLSDDAPYKQLMVSTIAQRIGKYAHVYGIFQRENTFELDWECFLEMMEEFGGAEAADQSDAARWVLLHISAYLSSRGHAHCLSDILRRALKFTVPTRSPVYVGADEIVQASDRLPERILAVSEHYASAQTRLRLERAVPSRHADIKYLRLRDIDEDARLVHFASSGHAHLKGGKHGSWYVPSEILSEVAQIKRHKLELLRRTDALLFADSQEEEPYRLFDTVTRATRAEIVAVTGCPQFRRHDLRASALTDIGLGLPIEAMLGATWRTSTEIRGSGFDLVRKHCRFYMAQRAARHTSPHTFLRHYNVGGMLDLRRELDIADRSRVRGARYVAAVSGVARCDRSREVFAEQIASIRSCLPVPMLGTPPPRLDEPHAPIQKATAGGMVHAAILHALGASALSIAVATQLSPQVVQHAIAKVESILRGSRQRPRAAVRVFSEDATEIRLNLHHVAKLYANFLVDSKRVARLKRMAPTILSAVGKNAHSLHFLRQEDFQDFMGAIGSFSDTGFRGFLSCGSNDELIHSTSNSEGVTYVAQSIPTKGMTLRFLLNSRRLASLASLQGVSPRTLGTDGRFAVVGLVAAISF